MKRVLIYATTAYMIDQFNMMNIRILNEMGCETFVACNFNRGNPVTRERLDEFRQELYDMGTRQFNLPLTRNIFDIIHNGRAFAESVRLLRSGHYDFVHCHTPVGAAIARLACAVTHTRVIYTAHGLHFYDGAPLINWLVYYPVEKLLSRFTDVLILINKEDYGRARRKFHMKRLEYVPGIGVDTERFNAAGKAAEGAKVRSGLGISGDELVLMSVGELSTRKNHMLVLESLSRLERTGLTEQSRQPEQSVRPGLSEQPEHAAQTAAPLPPYKYVIVGTGALDEKLKRYVNENGLGNRVIFTGYRNDVERLLKAADIFVFPSKQEGLPAALMQAMATGLPAVLSRIRGNTDLINENGGIFFDVKRPESVDKALRQAFSLDEAGRTAMGEYNTKKVRAFSREEVAGRLREIYGSMLN